MSLDQAKKAEKEALKMNYNSNIKDVDLEITYSGKVYQADYESYEKVIQALSCNTLPSGFFWLTKTNEKISLNKTQLQELADAMYAKHFSMFDTYNTNRINVDNADDYDKIPYTAVT